ncbi:ARM repeat-containing protein [Pleurotus eryngii]|uniref:ARM repeat-containing protein n=1 Tax=Pleurotus eryngii TaxID=5323 RepID=A0A9P6A799_PLEER|nr:ARM repeat-containing protein [Pleurotus eryngii]
MEHQPTVHILRPHHITLLAVILLALKEIESKNLAPAFSLHIYRVLLNEVIERRHIFGYFCRRCFVSFLKLSFEGVIKYHQDYEAWCNGDREAGYDIVHKDSLDNSYLLLLKSNVDKKTWAGSRSYEIFEAGLANGDMLTGEEHLRWFFEQRFHEGHDSLLNRLPPVEVGRKPVLNEIQPTSHPLEVLFDAKKLMDTGNDQNLGATFAKLAEVLGMLDHYSETQLIDSEIWAHHAVQSVAWNAIGCDRLTMIEEDIVTAFTVIGGNDNNRITVILNRAYRQARQGQYEAALAKLLEPDIWRGLTIRDYSLWANQVWHILALRASRRFEFGQASTAIEQLLTALWHAEFQGRMHLYRTGIILLADVGLEFGLTKRCCTILDEIMPQIITGCDLEQRALACFTLGRCIIAAKGGSEPGLQEALKYLLVAEADCQTIQLIDPLADVQYLISMIYHNLGMVAERDDAAMRHSVTLVEVKRLENAGTDDEAMDGPAPQEEDFSSIPIGDRITHKNWKARVHAYESLIKTFQTTASDTDPAFKPYINNSDLLKKIVTDSNAVAQEKGVECVVNLVRFAGETAAKTRDTVVPALVDKSFGSARAGTKAQAVELVLQYVEIENVGTGVVNDILPGLGAKQPKVVATTVVALKEIVRLFGIQVAPPAPILKALPKIFGHSDKTVRSEGTQLTHALYQWMGPGIETFLGDLKPVQVKELKEAFDAMESEGRGRGTLKAERFTRAQAREKESNVDAGIEDEGNQEEGAMHLLYAAPPDPRDFAEAVDVVPQLPPSFQAALTSSKWKERKEVLDQMLALLSATPKIKENSELGDLAKSLAVRIQGDANINCVMVAAGCMEALAKGLMSSFAKYREMVVGPMLERLKERKANVTDAIGVALDAIFATTTLSDIIPDLSSALASKNPQVKEGTLKFLARSLSTAKSPILGPQIKPMAESLSTLLEDSHEGARNEAAVCMGTLMKMVGERPLNAVVDSLADVRKAKVKEAYEKASVKCKSGAPAPPKPVASAPAPSSKKAPSKPTAKAAQPNGDTETEPAKKPAAKPPARLTAKKPPAASAPAAAAATKKAPPTAAKSGKAQAAAAAAGSLDSFKYKHTPEDAESLAAELIPAQITIDLADSNWKTRLAAIEEMTNWLESVIGDVDAEVVVRAIGKKGWNEKNFQVSASLYGILSNLAENCPSFGRSCIALSVPHLVEKLGDMKLKKAAGDTLSMFAEKTSLQFVLNQVYDPLSKQKAPKVIADAIAWINTALTDFGIAGLSLRSLIDALKTALQNSNAAVRTSATKTLVTVKLFAGSSIKDLLEDLNPQLMNTISGEFDKVEGQPAPEPSRTSADLANMAPSGSQSSGAAMAVDALDDLFPRIELDSLLKGTTILADAKNDAWKTKKEALETLLALLDQGSNKRLKPTMGEIGQVLKARVTDTNKAVQTAALDIVSRIATGMGKPFEKHCRLFVSPVATVLSDQKAPIRAAAIQTLAAIATACEGLEPLVHGITTALETSNPQQKGTLLNWLADWFKEHESTSSVDLNSWALPVVSCLDDRNSEVRKGAQALLPVIVLHAGYDYVMQQANSLKPASRGSAIPLIQAARPVNVLTPAPPASKPAPKAKSTPRGPSPPPPSPSPSPVPAPTAKATKVTGVRRKLPLSSKPAARSETPDGTGPRAPGKLAVGGVSKAGIKQDESLPFFSSNPDARKARTAKDSNKWVNEGGPTRKDLAELLQTQMEGHASKELLNRLFSHDHNAVNDHILGLSTLCEFFSPQNGDKSLEDICFANFDLPLKYASIKAHEPQPNLISKCLEVVETMVAFLRSLNYQLTDSEAMCFIPTFVLKLGDAREQVRSRVQAIIQDLPKIYAYSRLFQLLSDYGLKSKVAKTRQGSLDEMAGLLTKFGIGACEPNKACPIMASMIADKDSLVRKAALGALGEVYTLVGDKVWSLVGPLPAKDKTQLEERLRRVPGPSEAAKAEPTLAPPPQISRIAGGIPRPNSPAGTSRFGIPRSASPALVPRSKLTRPASPAAPIRANSPNPRPESPVRPPASQPSASTIPQSPTGLARPRSMLPSRLGLGRPRTNTASTLSPPVDTIPEPTRPTHHVTPSYGDHYDDPNEPPPLAADDITVTISSILSSDPSRSVDALKKFQKILAVSPDAGSSSPQYRELAEHTEGLIETITLQMTHIFDRPEEFILDENFRLAKHLIQTLNNFCDHPFLAESLTVDTLTSLLEELTLRLLETDDSPVKKVKDLSRFINMIILRLFATGRRMSIFRALFALLLQIVKPFPTNGTLPDSKEAKVAELVLKCIWKLARNIPQDLSEQRLDPVELFPAVEHFLQSVPPNEWRARATNKVPCGDMPLRTIKVIIQHVVAYHGDGVYDLLSGAFDDPSATIVYPYVYRILNSSNSKAASGDPVTKLTMEPRHHPSQSPSSSRPLSPQETASNGSAGHHRSPSHRTSPSVSSANDNGGYPSEEPDPDAQLLTIIGHISSETTGALHKEGITELHHFLKAYPHKRPRVEKMLESTGAAFRKYINRALASRAAEDQERDVAVADTLSKPESNQRPPVTTPSSPPPRNGIMAKRTSQPEDSGTQEKLSRLHDIFQYRSSTLSNGSSQGRGTERTSLS